MSENIKRKKDTNEPGNGGQFGRDARPDADLELADTSEIEAEELLWTGSSDVIIESETNPWLRDTNCNDINLKRFLGVAPDGTDCDACGPIAGVIAPMDSEFGIQRCDQCGIYEGDLEAAQALAKHIGGGATIWFLGTQ